MWNCRGGQPQPPVGRLWERLSGDLESGLNSRGRTVTNHLKKYCKAMAFTGLSSCLGGDRNGRPNRHRGRVAKPAGQQPDIALICNGPCTYHQTFLYNRRFFHLERWTDGSHVVVNHGRYHMQKPGQSLTFGETFNSSSSHVQSEDLRVLASARREPGPYQNLKVSPRVKLCLVPIRCKTK